MTYGRVRALTLALLTVLVAETAVGSSGRWLEAGPLSIRIVLLAATLLVSLPLVWRERRYLLGEGIVWVTALFFATLALSAAWGFHLGNKTGFIVNDLTTFAALLLVPTVIALRLRVVEVVRLVTVFFVAAAALAALTFAIHVLIPLGLLDPEGTADWLTDRSLGGLADVGRDMHRIYLRSQIMFIPAIFVGLHRIATVQRHRLWWIAGTSVVSVGLVISLSRSLWIGFGLALIVCLVWCARDLAALLRAIGLVAAGAAVLIGLSTAVYASPSLIISAAERLNPSMVVVVPETEEEPDDESDLSEVDAESVALRGATLQLTREQIRERPVVGWGIGHNLDEIRSDGRTEYMYWDLLMKLGLLGLVPFVLVYAWSTVGVLRRGGLVSAVSDTRVLAAGLLGIAVASYFNPFLNSSLGIVILLLLVAARDSGEDLERRDPDQRDSAPAGAASAG